VQSELWPWPLELEDLDLPVRPDLAALISIFYPAESRLGSFAPADAADTPEPFRRLLHHDHHMTVTLEDHHQSRVQVHVLQAQTENGTYCRRIILTRESDGKVVLFGIVRLNLAVLAADVQSEIIAGQTPLGRVLIEHNVLRQVEFHQLYRVACGPELADLLQVPAGTVVYGRTALIYCDKKPAVELLEIVPDVGLPGNG
jgi:chorismate-pyruvate lyase